MGVRNLLEEAMGGHPINWILYDRNPDLFVDGFNNPVHKGKIWSNVFNIHHDPRCIDLAVVAGTPEWSGLPLKGFYQTVKKGNIPLILIGVGYIDAPIHFNDDEIYCFRKLLKTAIVRDEYASLALNKIGISHTILPCPALFSSLKETVPAGLRKIGFTIQSNMTENQSVSIETSYACANTVNKLREKGFIVDVICHYIDEFIEFAINLAPVRYSYDASDYLVILDNYDLIISTRLHSAILANSLGKPAMLVNSDSRCTGAASQFPFIYNSTPETIIDDISTFTMKDMNGLIQWKAEIKDKYLLILTEALDCIIHEVLHPF